MIPLVLAPRTSEVVNNGWNYASRTVPSAGPTSTYIATIWQGTTGPAAGTALITVDAAAWELVAASPGCVASVERKAIACPVDFSGAKRQQVVTVTIRTAPGAPASFALSSL